ncbi:BEN domain-containing protein 3 [Conger conger]|uniref:BEN domain-containing protein 3 n=1 Tax=Conger conger TaxID=82655 RepID=UPI002A5AD44E|nr:BEN domain-containing protein 3 [Conger conger]
MNSSEFVENSDGETSEKERLTLCRVKAESEEPVSCAAAASPGRILGSGVDGAGKRAAAFAPSDGPNAEFDQLAAAKRTRVSAEGLRTRHSARPHPSGLMPLGESRDSPSERTIASYRKPLYSISHRIIEKKAASGLDQHALHEPGAGRPPLPKPGGVEAGRREPSPAAPPGEAEAALYPLIEKMFFILNTLNSSMTQLHSKVDLLSLEVTRIKRRVEPPAELAAEFQPPPEHRLTGEELRRLAEQTSSAGELGCRLLLQLFPELFAPEYGAGAGGGCSACGSPGGRRAPDSLHLQLVRCYVEACFPLVRNGDAWQAECLPQINDFFSRFWAQKDMEGAGRRASSAAAAPGAGFEPAEPGRTRGCLYIDEDGRDGASLSPESRADNLNLNLNNGGGGGGGDGNMVSDLIFDAQEVGEDLDDLSSPGDFAVFLMHRLFPEVFEEGKVPEGYGCYGGGGGVGKLMLDSDRLEVIRKYMEANFPDVSEDSWLQLCVQRMEEVLEVAQGNGEGSEPEVAHGDESYDSASLPDDVSVVKVGGDFRDYERPGQACKQAKKSSLVPIDFDKVEIPPPDFDVAPEFLLSREQLKANYECSLSIGNFASRLLVLMFPELFTYENARKNYNCSGSLGKKQLDPVRVNLIRHYVQLLYPRARNDRVWTLEFVGKLDERCRRRDTEQRRSYQQQRKVYAPEPEPGDFAGGAGGGQTSGRGASLAAERFRDDFEIPPLPPEKSSKDFCKIPLEDLTVSAPDFLVPPAYLLADAEVREVVQQSLSVGNFAARLLVRLFPELFTQENLRLQYNHSGACNKKQLDPLRLRLIRHYVEAVYPVDKMEEVWHYECVPSIDERCRRPNRKKCDILKKAKRSCSAVSYL